MILLGGGKAALVGIMNILRVKEKALELLERVEEDNSYLHLLLRQEAEGATSAPDEYPILVQLVRGVLQNRTALDEALSPYLSKGLSSLPSQIQNLLRLGAYQILFLERVKKRDVVFEAVEIAKRGKFRGLSSLVNAVLRKIEVPKATTHSSQDYDASKNFPDWLVARWNDQFGEEETRRFCAASSQALPMYIRVNSNRTSVNELRAELSAEGFQAELSPFSNHSLRLERIPKDKRLTSLDAFKGGRFFIQDLSSTIVADIVSHEKPLSVCDLCAAPGGKTCSVALSVSDVTGSVFAYDLTEKRAGLISDAVARLGLTNVTVGVRDAGQVSDRNGRLYDAVLLDAPCSGFGTLGRKVDARWSKSEETIKELTDIQTQLISNASRLVKPGGVIVYSTCTIETAENEEIVERFIESHTDFTVVPLSTFLPKEICTPEGYYRAWPHRHAMAGAFGAMLRRQGTA